MVVVVEGKHDEEKIKKVLPNAYVITTNGSAISDSVISEIKKLSDLNEIYLCLDPDGPGEKIRKTILNNVQKNVYNVYAIKQDAVSFNKKKIGIEHMTLDKIKELFANSKKVTNNGCITYLDLYKLGLMDSKIKRTMLCEKLNIGYCNAKQLVNKLNMHGIELDEVKEILNDCK